MTRSEVHRTCLQPTGGDKILNSDWFPSGMQVLYDKSPADPRLQRIQCILLPEQWPQSSGAAAHSKGLPQNLSAAQQQEQDKADSERARQIAELMKREQEEHKRTQRAQSLVESLHQSIAAQNRISIPTEFDELLHLNGPLAFSLLFPLAGLGCVNQIELLLRLNADQCCNTLDKDGRNALHEAASKNAVQVAQALHRSSKQRVNFLNLKVKPTRSQTRS